MLRKLLCLMTVMLLTSCCQSCQRYKNVFICSLFLQPSKNEKTVDISSVYNTRSRMKTSKRFQAEKFHENPTFKNFTIPPTMNHHFSTIRTRKKREMSDAQDPTVSTPVTITEQILDIHECNYKHCESLCKIIYVQIPIHLSQCMGNYCFCMKKRELYPLGIKELLKKHKLFNAIQQPYE
ncbi:uncharacterized protein LOC118203111 [Stegodyphus dumicola]|uniref:uncharacterized protein LOC118203111 n=1 Tax=Stegodyphus dumicola TaxID=202533 RepID=UPI0015AABCBC|nr:uncharacterized protein LOC118203111 [Stegodyphus dumicola]